MTASPPATPACPPSTVRVRRPILPAGPRPEPMRLPQREPQPAPRHAPGPRDLSPFDHDDDEETYPGCGPLTPLEPEEESEENLVARQDYPPFDALVPGDNFLTVDIRGEEVRKRATRAPRLTLLEVGHGPPLGDCRDAPMGHQVHARICRDQALWEQHTERAYRWRQQGWLGAECRTCGSSLIAKWEGSGWPTAPQPGSRVSRDRHAPDGERSESTPDHLDRSRTDRSPGSAPDHQDGSRGAAVDELAQLRGVPGLVELLRPHQPPTTNVAEHLVPTAPPTPRPARRTLPAVPPLPTALDLARSAAAAKVLSPLARRIPEVPPLPGQEASHA